MFIGVSSHLKKLLDGFCEVCPFDRWQGLEQIGEIGAKTIHRSTLSCASPTLAGLVFSPHNSEMT